MNYTFVGRKPNSVYRMKSEARDEAWPYEAIYPFTYSSMCLFSCVHSCASFSVIMYVTICYLAFIYLYIDGVASSVFTIFLRIAIISFLRISRVYVFFIL